MCVEFCDVFEVFEVDEFGDISRCVVVVVIVGEEVYCGNFY